MNLPRHPQPTLQTLIDAVAADPAISAGRRPTVLSSLRKAAKMQHKRPDQLRADSAALLGFLDEVEPSLHDITPKRLANIRSDMRTALENQGLLERRWIHTVEPTTAWREVMALVADDRYAKTWVYPFARFCSSMGVEPDGVDDAVSQAYHDARRQEGIASAQTTHLNMVRRWNHAIAHHQGWPQCPLTQPCYLPERRTLPDEVFPVSLIAERTAYLERLSQEPDPFDRHAPPRTYRPATVAAHKAHIRLLASELAHTGFPAGDIVSLAVVATNAKSIARAMWERGGGSKRESIAGPLATLVAIGKHWLQLPPAEIADLKDMHNKLRPHRRGMTKKNELLVHQILGDPAASRRFFRLPLDTMEKLRKVKLPSRADALTYQRALMCELLLHTALRVKNLATLHLERHFNWPPSGVCRITVPAEEVKNSRDLPVELPAEVAEHLRHYLERFRSMLMAPGDGDNPWLFPGQIHGRHKLIDTVAGDIKAFTALVVQGGINPHVFRHIIGTSVLQDAPKAYGVVARLLGHASERTSFATYTGPERQQQFGRLHNLIKQKQEARVDNRVKPGVRR